MTPQLQTIIDSMKCHTAKRLVSTAYPKTPQEETYYLIMGFRKSIVGNYWVLYEIQ
jgi:hypothetical protein